MSLLIKSRIVVHSLFICLVIAISVVSSKAIAQNTANINTYPTKPVRIIVPFPPGGSNDIVGRFIANKLTSRLGRQFVVDNRGGADSVIGTSLASTAQPDGYTLLIASVTYSMVPATGKKLPYDPIKSFVPVASIGTGPNLFAVWPGLPVHSIKELIAMSKANPGKLRYASSSTGGNHHFAAELFKIMAGVDIMQIPYKGGGPAMVDVMAGNVEIAVATLISAIPHVRSNRLRPLGVSSLKRSSIMPDVPTISEAGVPGYEGSIWWGIVGPAGIPVGIVNKLNAEVGAILREPDTTKWLEAQAAEPTISSPEEFRKHINSQISKWTKVAKESGIDKLVAAN
ncbi:MAG: tripartite tricarboxylate transporter substrate binding protein [Burkholderiales bacterium]|nr:tripartite tricarboxylate transporter substrate binding protein [Burkholderiales bacterium]MDP2396958.1 tripartite tricarboxylate transporter substrate binding protein [Burkholderiales bacterium]